MLVIFGLPIKPTKGTTNASRAAPVAPEARISTQQALYVRAFKKKSSHGRIEEGSGERGLAAKAAKAEPSLREANTVALAKMGRSSSSMSRARRHDTRTRSWVAPWMGRRKGGRECLGGGGLKRAGERG